MKLLLMAAGRSKRFKTASHGIHKLLYRQSAETASILEMTYTKARNVFSAQEICIVVNTAEKKVQSHAKQFGSSVLAIQSHGIGESLAQAVNRYKNEPCLLVLHADLPLIQKISLQKVVDAMQYSTIARPIYKNQAGHPVGFQQALYSEFIKLSGDQGANKILQQYTITYIPVQDPGTIQDIDTPYDALKYQETI